jgi:hypothetical protein
MARKEKDRTETYIVDDFTVDDLTTLIGRRLAERDALPDERIAERDALQAEINHLTILRDGKIVDVSQQ